MKPGDKITMKPGAKSLFGNDVGGLTGTITHLDPRPERGFSLNVEFPDVYGIKLVRPEDVLTVNNGYTDAQIDAALVKVKADNGYCSEFDRAVEEAKNLDLLGRLDLVAQSKNRGDIFRQLEDTLEAMNAPAPQFKEGDRVHYRYRDRLEYVAAFVGGEWYTEGTDSKFYTVPFPSPNRKIINTVNLAPGREYTVPDIPEIGKWIAAVTHDGNTHVFEVTKNETNGESCRPVFLGRFEGRWRDLFICLADDGYAQKTRNVVSWKYVDAPAKIVEIDGYFVVRDGYEVKVYTDKAAAEAYKGSGGLVHVTSVENGYEQIAEYAQRDATYQAFIPAVLAAIKFIAAESEGK